MLKDRLGEFAGVAQALGLDAVALVPGANFTRATGHSFGSNERPLVLIVRADGRTAAIVPNLELESWALLGFEGAVHDWRDQDGYQAAFDAALSGLSIGSVGVEGQVMRVFVHHALKAAAPELRVVDAEAALSGLRRIKTADEVAALEAAIGLSEAALARVIEGVKVGQTEKEIEQALILALFAEGAEGLAFPPIVAASDNSARPHAHARADYAVQAGDALLFDFGGRKHGFAADITRTFFVGHADDEARAVYETVLGANLKGHEVTRAGVTAHEIDDAVTGVLEGSPYAEWIVHKTGHGLGRDVHEAPYIMRGNHEALEAGTVYTNEPGLYGPGKFGVRIEDDVLVTENGCRSLTTFSKDLTIIGR